MKQIWIPFLSVLTILSIIFVSTPQPVQADVNAASSTKPYITFVTVEKDKSVRVRAHNFPAGVHFSIRVGPYVSFFREYVTTGTIYSGNGGTFEFTVNLPEKFKGASLVTVRLDGGGTYAFNAYRNVSQGSIGTTTPIPTPTKTPIPSTACQVISRSPGSVLPNADFDYVIEIKNTSGRTWDKSAVDYKYSSGSAWHKRSIYDLNKTVNNGEIVKVIIDVKAPSVKGSYSATWLLVEGNRTICTLPVNFSVR